jgi:hypothetical protein
MLIKVPAAVAAERTRNSRRVVEDGVNLSMTRSLISGLGGPIHDLAGPLDGADDARVGGAATEIAGHAVEVGFGFFESNAAACMIWPDWQ